MKSVRLGIENGVTSRQWRELPPLQFVVSCHSPGVGAPGVWVVAGEDPSFARAAIIAAAAASPVAMPAILGRAVRNRGKRRRTRRVERHHASWNVSDEGSVGPRRRRQRRPMRRPLRRQFQGTARSRR